MFDISISKAILIVDISTLFENFDINTAIFENIGIDISIRTFLKISILIRTFLKISISIWGYIDKGILRKTLPEAQRTQGIGSIT